MSNENLNTSTETEHSEVSTSDLLDKPPKKRWEICVEVAGHSREEAASYLRDMLFRIKHENCNSSVGGGGFLKVTENKDAPDKEEYEKLLQDWWISKKVSNSEIKRPEDA